MSIVATNKSQQGRVVYIKSNPIVGCLALTSFTDDATSPGGGRQFVKTFRYSTNGVLYSTWQPLTVQAITAIQVDPNDPFLIEIAYEKDEPLGTSSLDVNEVTIGTVSGTLPLTPFFNNSLFAKYFTATDQSVLNWYVNVLQKLWDKGLIPNYMDRDPLNPDDFLGLWSAVTQFFAYYVTFARTYATFYNNIDILSDFLQQRGLNVSPEDTLGQLQTMLLTFYYQMSKRGGVEIVNESDTSSDSKTGVMGEMKRLIHYKTVDEFLFLLFQPQNYTWCLGRSSPCYRGVRINDGLNKAPWSVGYNDMTASASFLTTGGSVITDGSKKVAQLNASSLTVTNGIKIDPNLDYEFSFQVKLAASKKLSFDIHGFNATGASTSLLSYKDGTVKTAFFDNAVLSRSDSYLMVRCALFNHSRGTYAGDLTNIRQGQNLKSTTGIQNIGFTISSDGQANIYDFKILPIMTDYSRGFLQSNNFIAAWIKNRNSVYSTIELESYISKYLIPYNAHIKLKNSGDLLYTTVQEDPDTTFWIGAGEYCQRVVWVGANPSCELINLAWVPEESTSFCEQV